MSKKSFVLHLDSLDILDELNNEQAGLLFKAIKKYQSGIEPELDFALKIAFIPFKNQFLRDAGKYEDKINKTSNSGRLGNLKRWHNDLYKQVIENQLTTEQAEHIANGRKQSQNIANAINTSQTVANIADSVSDSVNVSDNVSVNDNDVFGFNEFWKLYPNKIGKAKCEPKFKKLTNIEKQKIKETINAFIAYKPFKDYNHPNPETYLNQKRWQDELPILTTKSHDSEKTVEQKREEKLAWFRSQGF